MKKEKLITSYMQRAILTDKEKLAVYMKTPKKKLAEMLLNCNKFIDGLGINLVVNCPYCHKQKILSDQFCNCVEKE